MKKIGILSSGGDAPGMNAAIRAVTRAGLDFGMEVVGIRRGYQGLLDEDFEEMTSKSVSGIIQKGGTILHSARCLDFKTLEGQKKAVENIKKIGIEGLVAIGGDGTFQGAKTLSEKYGIPTIGIPGTIDNDLAYTDYTLGFDTACNTATTLIANIRDTMNSHERVGVIEVMGRNCGDIALYAGIAAGAEVIIVPEVKMSIEEITDRVNKTKVRKSSCVVVVAEGAGTAEYYSNVIEELTGFVAKPTVLGHVLRGGSPTMRDRLLGTQTGYMAAELLAKGIGNRVIGIKGERIINEDIIEALAEKNPFREDLYLSSKVLGF